MVTDAPEDAEAKLAADRARGAGVSFVARVDRTTDARERRPMELEVDVKRLHFFDSDTGLGVYSNPE